MSNAITISGTKFKLVGTVLNRTDKNGIGGLSVTAFDKDLIGKDDFLGIATTDASGKFQIDFDLSDFSKWIFDRNPDIYFSVKECTDELLNSKDDVIKNAGEDTPPITLWVNDFDSNAPGAGKVPALGWVGGFAESKPEFAYPDPDLGSLPMLGNLDNIDKLQRQQKVLWPEFSWESIPGKPDSRCYQMFAPDISRLGYTNEGRVYSIICPQQGACLPSIGCANVEVTVTGNRGWVDETNTNLAADMTVVGKVWFSPSAQQNPIVKRLWEKFAKSDLPFPSDKASAFIINTSRPGEPDQPIFPLTKGQTTQFPIPDFAKHPEAWDVAHLGVEIGAIVPTGNETVDNFNQLFLDLFNAVAGNMLKNGNTLSWNVWFIAPQRVDQEEWKNHAEKWRKSIQADHGSPEGNKKDPRYFDGSPFTPLDALRNEAEAAILKFESELL
jgi:hypothetical protein